MYVAAFAPDEGETLADVEGASKDSVLNSAIRPSLYPTAQGTETEFHIDAEEELHGHFLLLPDLASLKAIFDAIRLT